MKSVHDLILTAKSMPRRTVAVAAAHDGDVLRAVADARRGNICDAMLVGNGPRIREILRELGPKDAVWMLRREEEKRRVLAEFQRALKTMLKTKV